MISRLRAPRFLLSSIAAAFCAALARASDDDLVKPKPWEVKQWVGFAVYAALLTDLILLAWRLARPDPPPADGSDRSPKP